jgi:rhodanese-related sulfurtransferase
MRLRTAGIIPARRVDRDRRPRGAPRRFAPRYTRNMLEYEISPREATNLLLQNELRQNPVRLIDVREPWEFATARIAGSELMPMGDVPSRAHQEIDPDERVIVICHHGMRSLNVTVWLRDQGFEHVQSLHGGIDAWSAEVDPSIARY